MNLVISMETSGCGVTGVLFSNQGLLYKVKGKDYRPGVAQRVGRGIALLLHDRGTRRG